MLNAYQSFFVSGDFSIVKNTFENVHKDDFEVCPICERSILYKKIEIHHSPPKAKGGNHSKTIRLCGTCHDVLHFFIPIEEITKYNTIEKIKKIEPMQKYLAWVQTKKNGIIYKLKKIIKFIKED